MSDKLKITFNVERLAKLIDENGGVVAVGDALREQAPEFLAPKNQTLYLWRKGKTQPSSEILPYLALVLGCNKIDDLYLFEKVKG